MSMLGSLRPDFRVFLSYVRATQMNPSGCFCQPPRPDQCVHHPLAVWDEHISADCILPSEADRSSHCTRKWPSQSRPDHLLVQCRPRLHWSHSPLEGKQRALRWLQPIGGRGRQAGWRDPMSGVAPVSSHLIEMGAPRNGSPPGRNQLHKRDKNRGGPTAGQTGASSPTPVGRPCPAWGSLPCRHVGLEICKVPWFSHFASDFQRILRRPNRGHPYTGCALSRRERQRRREKTV